MCALKASTTKSLYEQQRQVRLSASFSHSLHKQNNILSTDTHPLLGQQPTIKTNVAAAAATATKTTCSHNTKADTYTATTANDDDHERLRHRWRLQQLWEIFVSIVSAFQLQIDFIRFGSVLRCLLSVGRLVETVGRCRRRWNEQKQTR